MASPSQRRPVGRIVGLVLLALFVALVAVAWSIGAIGGNWRTVAPGAVYRSAQLSAPALRRAITAHGLKTVINLRGASPTEAWYRDETAVCRQLGVAHVDVALWARRLPEPKELAILLAAYDRGPYPLLIHCQGGADRSGLAATLYQISYRRQPLARALPANLTWRYGHFKSKAYAMDHFFALYQQTGQDQTLRAWIEKRYPTIYAREMGR